MTIKHSSQEHFSSSIIHVLDTVLSQISDICVHTICSIKIPVCFKLMGLWLCKVMWIGNKLICWWTEREAERKLESFRWILIWKQILVNFGRKLCQLLLENELCFDNDLNLGSLNHSNNFEIMTFSWKSFTILLDLAKASKVFFFQFRLIHENFLKPKPKIKYDENPTTSSSSQL